jgi:hypothetical protein
MAARMSSVVARSTLHRTGAVRQKPRQAFYTRPDRTTLWLDGVLGVPASAQRLSRGVREKTRILMFFHEWVQLSPSDVNRNSNWVGCYRAVILRRGLDGGITMSLCRDTMLSLWPASYRGVSFLFQIADQVHVPSFRVCQPPLTTAAVGEVAATARGSWLRLFDEQPDQQHGNR